LFQRALDALDGRALSLGGNIFAFAHCLFDLKGFDIALDRVEDFAESSAVMRGMATFESATDSWLHLGAGGTVRGEDGKEDEKLPEQQPRIVVLDAADGLAGTGKEGTGVFHALVASR